MNESIKEQLDKIAAEDFEYIEIHVKPPDNCSCCKERGEVVTCNCGVNE